MNEFELLMSRLHRQGQEEAIGHFMQAQSTRDRGEWEASNSQLRTALESLFNGVAAQVTGTTKTAGQARKALEDGGHLRTEQAKLVQAFFGVAGGSGSHAGTSSEDDCRSRFLVAMGIAYVGLALMPELVRFEDVYADRLRMPKLNGETWPRDRDLRTACAICLQSQTLDQARCSRDGADTVYTCVNGCHRLVIVSPVTGGTPWLDEGFRIADYVLRVARDIQAIYPPTGNVLNIKAGITALMDRRSVDDPD